MPAAGMRRLIVGWSNFLPHIYGDILTCDASRANAFNVQHAGALKAASSLPVLPLAPSFAPLSTAEEAWARHVTATPGFLNSFGQRGWKQGGDHGRRPTGPRQTDSYRRTGSSVLRDSEALRQAHHGSC